MHIDVRKMMTYMVQSSVISARSSDVRQNRATLDILKKKNCPNATMHPRAMQKRCRFEAVA